MLFKYKGLNKKGEKHSGNIEANDKKSATIKLREKGIFPQSLKEQKPSLSSRINFQSKEKINPTVLSHLSRDISIYLKAEISIVNAIKLASTQYKKNKKLYAFLVSIGTLLDEGKSFAVALDTQKIYEIPHFFLQSVKISENGGILGEVLEEMARFIKEMEGIKKQIKSNLFYPIFIIIVSILMIIFMITVVVPKITSIFEQMGQELPGITKFVIGSSNFLGEFWLILLIGLFLIVASFTGLMKLSKTFKYGVDKTLLKLPIIGKTIMTTELARFSYMISVLLRSGVPFVQGLSLSANILGNSVIRKLFLDASVKVVEGGKFSSAINSNSIHIDDSFVQAISLGEETSELEKILSNLSQRYFEENRERIGIFLSLLEPALMLFVGGSIGFIVISMLLPIFSMNIG